MATKVYKKILQKLTPKYTENVITDVQRFELPDKLQKWVDEYMRVGGERKEFIWKWIYKICQIITLEETQKNYEESLWEAKFLMIMFVVLLDDVADKYGNKKLLNELLKTPFNKVKVDDFSENEKNYLNFTKRLWHQLYVTFSKYPRYKEFSAIINYDIKQVLNAMEYSYLINNSLNMINIEEYWVYLTHNMQYIVDVMFDVSCCRTFAFEELGGLREVSWYAQQMTRIGNWLSTWERELNEKDYTSGVFAYALGLKVVSQKDLLSGEKADIVDRIKNAKLETALLDEWERRYQIIKRLGERIKSVDCRKILTSLEKVLLAHMSSRGYK